MTFDVYLKNGWIKPHQTSPDEIRRLLAIVDRDIAQSKLPDLQPEWQFDIAYNAALQSATAALAASGYDAERQNKHQRIIECLRFAIPDVTPNQAAFLDQARQKRHISVYDRVGAISAQESQEMIAFAERLGKMVRKWLKSHHAPLMK